VGLQSAVFGGDALPCSLFAWAVGKPQKAPAQQSKTLGNDLEGFLDRSVLFRRAVFAKSLQ
jgi:hypothetical protein